MEIYTYTQLNEIMEKHKHGNKFKVNSKKTRIKVGFLNLHTD